MTSQSILFDKGVCNRIMRQSTQGTFKKDWKYGRKIFLWASSLTALKTRWLLSFSQDFMVIEKSGIALDMARSSGAGVLLSEWRHAMLRCESLEWEHSSHTSFMPPTSPPTEQHTNTPSLLLHLQEHATPPWVILFLPRGLLVLFPKQGPTYFS